MLFPKFREGPDVTLFASRWALSGFKDVGHCCLWVVKQQRGGLCTFQLCASSHNTRKESRMVSCSISRASPDFDRNRNIRHTRQQGVKFESIPKISPRRENAVNKPSVLWCETHSLAVALAGCLDYVQNWRELAAGPKAVRILAFLFSKSAQNHSWEEIRHSKVRQWVN